MVSKYTLAQTRTHTHAHTHAHRQTNSHDKHNKKTTTHSQTFKASFGKLIMRFSPTPTSLATLSSAESYRFPPFLAVFLQSSTTSSSSSSRTLQYITRSGKFSRSPSQSSSSASVHKLNSILSNSNNNKCFELSGGMREGDVVLGIYSAAEGHAIKSKFLQVRKNTIAYIKKKMNA